MSEEGAPPNESTERALALSLLGTLLLRERRATRALVRAERFTLHTIRAAVEAVLGRAALSAVRGPDELRDTMVAVRRTVPAVRNALEHALLEARLHARRAGAASLGLPRRDHASADEDAAAAHTTASSYAAAWGAAALAVLLAGAEKHAATGAPTSLATAFSPAPLDYRLRRIAATETARAFNDARLVTVRDHHDAQAGVFQVWSAILDRRTCGDCFDRDGRTIELHASFGATPPLHVCCRCLIAFVWVPLPERLDDIAFDYERFKREMRDLVRERRVASKRHAPGFVHASMGRDRSPVVLTRKFRELSR